MSIIYLVLSSRINTLLKLYIIYNYIYLQNALNERKKYKRKDINRKKNCGSVET